VPLAASEWPESTMGFVLLPYPSQLFTGGSLLATGTPVRWLALIFSVFIPMILAGCGGGSRPSAALATIPFGNGPRVLLFVGTGTSATDVVAIKSILDDLHIDYATADSGQLNAMSEVDLMSHHLLIVPGGDSIEIGGSLSLNATAMIRDAVERNGLHYLGICAGAFFGGASIYNGVDLTSGVGFDFFADEQRGSHKEAVNISFPDRSVLNVYWEDGPQLSGWGDVVATYPDSTPAITEGRAGAGFVMFTGVHLEAPEEWRKGLTFTTPISTDIAYAKTVIQSALDGTSLPHF
jgi:glutamine amidotransferase-like uncharacterized protein